MPTVVATPGASDANSFVTIERALEIIDTLPWQGSWPTQAAASATLGSGADGTVTASLVEPGDAGNTYTLEAVLAGAPSAPLSVALVGTALTVTLGTTALGAADPAKNTAALVAAAIGALADFTAVASGTGTGVIPVSGVRSFAGGDSRTDDIARLLIAAARAIRTRVPCWTGTPTFPGQALPWPRTGMVDWNGTAIPDDVIPEDIEVAAVTMSVALAKSDVTAPDSIADKGITKVKAGPVEIDFDKASASGGPLPSNVLSMFPASWLCPLATGAPFMFAIT